MRFVNKSQPREPIRFQNGFNKALKYTTKAVNTKPWFKSVPMAADKLKSLMKTMSEKPGL